MQPVLFSIAGVQVYAYGLLIGIGAALAWYYFETQGKKEAGLSSAQSNMLFAIIILAAVIGGKIFLLLESRNNFTTEALLSGHGFVFYGSFLFVVPSVLLFFKLNKLPVYTMLDILSVSACMVHSLGRLGCFMAGCCYGKPTHSNWGVVFNNPQSMASPLHTHLYPVQLMESFYILLILVVLLVIKKRYQRFRGQLFLLYIALYAAGRSMLELFRGDEERGFWFSHYISNAQLIALLIIGAAIVLYARKIKSLQRQHNLSAGDTVHSNHIIN